MSYSFNEIEHQRKLFHGLSIIVPMLYLEVTKLAMVIMLLIATTIILFIDISRHYDSRTRKLVDGLFQNIMRNHEKSGSFRLCTASYVALGLLLTVIFFNKGLAICCSLVLIIANIIASLIGTKVRQQIIGGKSLEGAGAFFVSSLMIGVISTAIVPFPANFFSLMVASLCTSMVALYADKISINDNLMIPLTYGFIVNFCLMWT